MKRITLSLFVLIGFSNVWGQDYNLQYPTNAVKLYGQSIDAGSARYTAMAGALGGLGGNLNSTEQNPAGLGVAVASEVAFTASVDGYKNLSEFGASAKAKDNFFDVKQAGGSFVFDKEGSNWNRFVIGVNFLNEQLDDHALLGANENVFTTDQDNNRYTMNGFSNYYNGYKTKFSVNFATSYADKIYLGANVNFHETNYTNEILYSDRSPSGMTHVYDLEGSPYAEIGQGFSFGLGVIGKVNQNVRLGAAFHSPVWYKVDEEFHALNNNGNYELYASNYKLKSAGRLVGSAGFVVGKSLALGLDYTYHLNKMTDFRTNGFDGPNSFIDDYVNNSSEFRVGGEYRLDRIKLRAGYSFVESPMKDVTVMGYDYSDPNAVVRVPNSFNDFYVGNVNKYSLGVGYDFGGFYLDAAYRFATQKYHMPITGYFVGSKENVAIDNVYNAEVERKNNLFLLTLGWQF